MRTSLSCKPEQIFKIKVLGFKFCSQPICCPYGKNLDPYLQTQEIPYIAGIPEK
jgi:hypothetical protein